MVCDRLGRPLTFFLSPGQMSDAKGALALLDALPPATMLLADKGYDADWFREALEEKGISACIPARRGRKNPAGHDRKLYKQRHRIENLFRPPQGLAPHRHPLRPMRRFVPLRHLYRRDRHILVVSPDPSH
jgi:transposase